MKDEITHYDTIADSYAAITEKSDKEIRNKMYRLLPRNLNGCSLLDVGCGSGHDAIYYKKQGAKVYGIDPSEKEIAIAKSYIDGNFLTGTMDKLPYQNDFFDFVVSTYALQNSPDVTKATLEMIRVAKPNGIINIATKHPFRNLLEAYVNDKKSDYFNMGIVTSKIFEKKIILQEPGHTMQQYLDSKVLAASRLTHFSEHEDFPASEQMLGLNHPTYMIMQFVKVK